ncbi:MAG: SusC/RagA family TonB-linked outer membrane protein [Bacteroidales bacterium]|nr:SusC/RagA family TonB-linked outer membrane protein [Bacteroidales bacterium]
MFILSNKLSRFFAVMCALVLGLGTVMAQNLNVTGKVTDQRGEPVVGAYVVVKGTSNGAATDVNGVYSLTAPSRGTLEFSSMGYKTVEVAVNGRQKIDMILEDDALMLEDAVVTAMGIKKEKKSLGYAMEEVSSTELMRNKTANPISSLSGKVAGVNITQSSGAAGSGAQIILRGATSGSETKDSQPLFVVDGVIYDNSSSLVGNSAFDGTIRGTMTTSNRLMDINPEDIESMSVLKGPAASALYGSRAANGVIIITTKKGKEGRVEVNFNSKISTSWVTNLPKFQNEYARGYIEDLYPGGKHETAFNDFSYNSWGTKSSAKTYDNLGQFFKGGLIVDESLSVAGGTKTNNFFLSGSFYDQGGVVPGTGYTKYTFRFNGEQKIGNIFTVGANAAYSQAETDKTLTSGGLYNSSGNGALYSAYVWSPFDDMKHYLNEDGTRYRLFGDRLDPWDERENPYWIINKDKLTDQTNRFTGSLFVNAKIFDWWTLNYRLGIDTYTQTNRNRIAAGSVIKQAWQKGMMSDNTRQYQYLSHNVTSNMNKKFGEFELGLLLGGQIDQTSGETEYMMAWNFSVPDFFSYANASADYKQFSHGSSLKRLAGVFGEFRASWRNMLYLTVTGRNDWTSTLPVANRSYFYPSVSGSFVFSELIPKNDVFTFGKIRASWAKVGKDTGVYETNTALWPVGTYLGGITGVGNSWTRGNPYLKPEMTKSTEIGIELGFFNGRLHIDYAYYTNDSYNQILSPRGPQSTGYIFCSINAANVYNKGMELSISGTPVETRDFVWESTLNLAGNRGKLDGLPDGTDVMYVTDVQYAGMKAASYNGGYFMGIAGTAWNKDNTIVGESGKVLYQTTNQVVLDKNGMPTYTTDLSEVGNREAVLTGGFNNTFTWKGLSLNMLWEFSFGGDVVNGTRYTMDQAGTSANSAKWRNEPLTVSGLYKTGTQTVQDGDKTKEIPVYEAMTHTWNADQEYEFNGKLVSGYNIIKSYYTSYYPTNSANYITKVNLFRLRSLGLSYSLPKKWMDATGFIKRVTVSATANNILLFTNYDGDPEVAAAGAGVGGSSSVGFDYCGVPATAGMTFGLNLTF